MKHDETCEKMLRYQEKLKSWGMLVPEKWEPSDTGSRFYKPVTDLTAFVVNLRRSDYGVEAVCGFASTAFTRMVGDENALRNWGVSSEDITIREIFLLCDDDDERAAEVRIQKLYCHYRNMDKDTLLACAKEKRKKFIQQIACRLKPLGFRKKANTWTRPLTEDFYVMFNAQKSGFSDEYYFNLYIGKNGTTEYGDCYYTRVFPQGMCPMDWQALTEEELDFFLDRTVVPELERIIRTPLEELGKQPLFWGGCHCSRRKCEVCWMEKNLWQAKG